ncbi:MAG: transposase [Candidatus Thermoplasmatota archaeon]
MKSRISFSPVKPYLFFVARGRRVRLSMKGATGEKFCRENISSSSYKKPMHDTRNNWVTMMFSTHKRYRNFRKQSHIDTCTKAFHDLEHLGFQYGEFGFSEDHIHFQVNIPKQHSIQNAEIILKSYTSRKMFEAHPGFRKRYPRGSFWSGYEHHESTGLIDLEKSINYWRSQQQRHGVHVFDDRQQKLPGFAAE